MIEDIGQRFSSLIPGMQDYGFHIFGCGAIGSSVGIQLARLLAQNVTLYDYDSIEMQNVGVSEYQPDQVDKLKVNMLSEMMERINPGMEIAKIGTKIDGDSRLLFPSDSIVVLAFDSMESRLHVAEKACEREVKALIDTRMGAETLQLYTMIDPAIEEYLATWYSDEEGSKEPCTARATPYCSNMAGAFAANAIRRVVTDQPYYKEVVFHFPSMTLNIRKELT